MKNLDELIEAASANGFNEGRNAAVDIMVECAKNNLGEFPDGFFDAIIEALDLEYNPNPKPPS